MLSAAFSRRFIACALAGSLAIGMAHAADAPKPLIDKDKAVDWWVAFKLNSTFPACAPPAERSCAFGGDVQKYKVWGQQFVYASSADKSFRQGTGCAGDTATDPIGETFGQIYNGSYFYVVWNDQFYDDPKIKGCTKECSSPWGHSKGMVAWNAKGEGLVLQVSTPSWPASGSKKSPRKSDGNTLGCVKDDDVEVSQHFFSLKLTKDDLVKVLKGLANASVVTDRTNKQIVRNGGPADVQKLVNKLGVKSSSKIVTKDTLSSGVTLISKPSDLNVPPWQMVSALLGGASLRAATWWASPEIPTTTASTSIGCWDASLPKPGAVEIATTGTWNGKTFGLTGGSGPNYNHAKIAVATSGTSYAIFGDMNQQGTLGGQKCWSSQNGRGGLFYAVSDDALAKSVADLIKGDTAPAK